jgi:hypothetical protein
LSPSTERGRIAADEIAADDKRLRETLRRRLHRISEMNAPLAAVAQQLGEARRIFGR